jgi:lysophospholipase L1-like esterase
VASGGDSGLPPEASADVEALEGCPAERPDSSIAEYGGADAGGEVSEAPGIQFFGRWDFPDGGEPTGSWGDIYLKARFEGTSVGIVIDDAKAYALGNEYEYSVDGAPLATLVTEGAAVYPLASGLADGAHTLELYRRTEGLYGETLIGGLVLDPGKQVLVPPPRPSRRIEIIGDSISAGYGNDGSWSNSSTTEDGYMAFGPQLARLFGAEWSVIAHSGRGLYKNLGEIAPYVQPHMPDEFKLIQYLDSDNVPAPSMPDTYWSFRASKPDVVIIELGTNDFAEPPPFPAEADFVAAYRSFLTFLRGVYPNAEIFCLGTFVPETGYYVGEWQQCNAYICEAASDQNDAGDSRVHCVNPCADSPGGWLPDASDYIGDGTHPTAAGDTIIANHLHDIIAPVMGW